MSTDNDLRLKRALVALQNLRSELDAVKQASREPIAVVGMGCRFPGANNPSQFWQLLRDGRDAIVEVPRSRWNVDAHYDPDPDAEGKMYTRHGGFIEAPDAFDAAFFGISGPEADSLDPQQRLILEVGWEALENAAISPDRLSGSSTGVFIGMGTSDYLQLLQRKAPERTDLYMLTGNAHCVTSGRLSYLLGLQGPSMVVDTACSSSLVSTHLAVMSLRNGECDLALAGGVTLMLTPEAYIAQCRARMLSPDGRCHTFSAQANGYVRGEGCGVVVLKRLSAAQADGDRIWAVIRGSAVNQDGRTNGLTAPNGLAQQAVIRRALENAGVKPSEVGYVEAHGTATPLGDPIEVSALGAVFRERNSPLLVGSVKTNIGHLEPGAGIAGLIKTVLALQHAEIPKSLHFDSPNPHISWDQVPVRVATECIAWPGEGRRVAGVSSFGFSGTNAHMVLEAPQAGAVPATPSHVADRPLHVLTLSGKSEEALRQLADRYREVARSSAQIGDLCFTANTGRAHFRHRLAVVAANGAELEAKLAAYCAHQSIPGLVAGRIRGGNHPKIAFLFTGQGSQMAGMGFELFQTQPVFRRTLERCAELLNPWLDTPLLSVLFAKEGSEAAALLDTTQYTQPALFALEYALASFWQSIGVIPDVVMGHSIGELAAACFAGVFSLEDGLKLSAARGRLMQSLCAPGAMISVMSSEADVEDLIAAHRRDVALAAVNGRKSIVLSGRTEIIERIAAELAARGIKTRPLKVSHAFHSPLMDPMLAEFSKVAAGISYAAPQIPIVSNATGLPATDDIATAAYWVRHVREPVRFAESMSLLHRQGITIFVEVGPKPTLLGMGKTCYQECAVQQPDGSGTENVWLPSLRPGHGDTQQMLTTLSELYVQNVPIDWVSFDREFRRRRLELPTYPFQRQKYWIRTEETAQMPEQNAATDKAQQSILARQLSEKVAGLLNREPSSVETDLTLVEMGADSLLLANLAEAIKGQYGVEVGVHQLFDELGTVDALVAYIGPQASPTAIKANGAALGSSTVRNAEPLDVNHSPPRMDPRAETLVGEPVRASAVSAAPAGDANALERIMAQQLQLVQQVISDQLAVMRAGSSSPPAPAPIPPKPPERAPSNESSASPTVSLAHNPPEPTKLAARKLQPAQQRYLDDFIRRYVARTAGSKQHAQRARPHLDDGRSRRVLRPETWEINYPIVAERGQGGCFIDIDGNRFVDTCMGYGSLLFGHNAPFIQESIAEQMGRALDVGPDLELGIEVAELLCEMTKMERVKFTTSGTGAVRTALRLARAATGRSRFVFFSGAYHGQSDAVLAVAGPKNDPLSAMPMAPGISPRAVGDALVLPNNDPKSLEIIRAHAHELAGILVEPVQSRNPGLQPREFLRKLRELATEVNVPLIFDEVITGFRMHPGGAQALFGIQADIASYGKVIGGGMPLGVVAGKYAYMDYLDSAMWRYQSAPEMAIEPTFAASTFEKHPLAMAATRAVLLRLRQEGVALQEKLNDRTRRFVESANAFFAERQVPIEMAHFGSLYRFTWKSNISYLYQPLEMDLFYYHLISKGVYVWEGRTCYLSVAHTDEDIATMLQAIKDSVTDMQEGGFLAKSSADPSARRAENDDRMISLGEEQRTLWAFTKMAPEGSPDWQIFVNFRLKGQLSLPALQKSVDTLVRRHEALRTTVHPHEPVQIVHAELPTAIVTVDLTHEHAASPEALTHWLAQTAATPFSLGGPLFRVYLVKLAEAEHVLALAMHHLISDGWSTGILLEELAALYRAECNGTPARLGAPLPYRAFLEWQSEQRRSAEMAAHEAHWISQWPAGLPVTKLPMLKSRSAKTRYQGARHSCRLSPDLSLRIKALGRTQGMTLFMTLLAAFGLLLHRLTGQAELVIGTPTAGRATSHRETLVGYCTHLLPIRSRLENAAALFDYLATVKRTVLTSFAHQAYPFSRLLQALEQRGIATEYPGFNTIFNLDRAAIVPALSGLQAEVVPSPTSFSLVDLRLDCIELADAICLDFEYRTDSFDAATIAEWQEIYVGILRQMIAEILPQSPHAHAKGPGTDAISM